MEKYLCTTLVRLILMAVIIGVLFTPTVMATESTDARLLKMEKAMESLQAEIAELKAERAAEKAERIAGKSQPQAVNQKQIDAMVGKAIESQKADITGIPDWINNIKFSGDFRYRHESIDDNTADNTKRNRNRIRLRYGFTTKVNDEWDAIVRLATGDNNGPTSTNQTLGNSSASDDGFSSKEVWLDMAYTHWHPDWNNDFNMYFGKMKNPFYAVGKHQLIWDGDVTPEGIAASYNMEIDTSTTATINAAGFWMAERSSDADSGLFGAQGLIKHILNNGNHVLAGASYYDIGNISQRLLNSSGSTPTTSSNTADADGNYMYDYDMFEAFAEYGFKAGDMPVNLFSSFIENTAAQTEDKGYVLGLTLNKTKAPGSWQFDYKYQDLEADASLAALNDGDFIGGKTNGKGSIFSYKYQLAKNLQAALTYYDNEQGADNDNYKKVQADMIFKF